MARVDSLRVDCKGELFCTDARIGHARQYRAILLFEG